MSNKAEQQQGCDETYRLSLPEDTTCIECGCGRAAPARSVDTPPALDYCEPPPS
jgi:hypothetical protein